MFKNVIVEMVYFGMKNITTFIFKQNMDFRIVRC
jgi:hypothetical protein